MGAEGQLTIRGITKRDYDYVVSVLDRWWGGPAGQRADPFFFYELGQEALVAELEGKVVGFLLGFVARTSEAPVGYVHLVGIDPHHRRKGVGKQLYTRFADRCREAGAKSLKAIAAVGNEGSTEFHEALGFTAAEVEDYAGPGRSRMVFERAL